VAAQAGVLQGAVAGGDRRCEAMPRNPAGKLLKGELKRLYLS
jgi:hypothetical protein